MPVTLTFIGTASCTPPAGNETACLLVNGHLLVDTGWCAALSLLRCGHDATELDHVLITHCHHDHYMGLASVFFYRRMQGARMPADAPELRVIGPAEDIGRVVELARAYLQVDRFSAVQTNPQVVPLQPGEGCSAGELAITTAPGQHQVQALACRLRDTNTGIQIGVSGDTAYKPDLAEFFAGVDVLVYEASTGTTDPAVTPETGHSGVRQSAAIARDARVGRLYIVHTNTAQRVEIMAAAREVFPESHWPEPGMTLVW
ncbi:MAG TPA: MBL fold metallo-hydrolase [Armatimonadota bacterium]|nr:MBL fold metallo-hydrolase [Armatimonadota bacterium]